MYVKNLKKPKTNLKMRGKKQKLIIKNLAENSIITKLSLRAK